MNEIRSVGIPSPRVEGEQKVGGAAVYAVDVALPDMLWAKVLRSPIAHGRIKRIDAAKALGLPGVKAVLTGADLAGARIGKKIVDMPLLARRRRALRRREGCRSGGRERSRSPRRRWT